MGMRSSVIAFLRPSSICQAATVLARGALTGVLMTSRASFGRRFRTLPKTARQSEKDANENGTTSVCMGATRSQHSADRVGTRILAARLQKLLQFPVPRPGPELFSLSWYAGAIELLLAPLLILGLFTQPVAFILAGEMAFAYWIGHASRSIYPSVNGGNLSIMYCFVFFYLAFASGGPWSLDHIRQARGSLEPIKGMLRRQP
jgi:putative oxidoreductase